MTVETSASTRREYAARMNRVVDYIQNHLADPLDLGHLATVACFSSFHFHRLFRAWMGETLQAFVHRLRLERAAQLLVFDKFQSISDIASECGFSSSSTFAALSSRPLGRLRANGESARSVKRIAKTGKRTKTFFWDSRKRHTRTPWQKLQRPLIRVQRLAPETIAYIRHIGPYKGDPALFRRLFGQLFAWAGPRGLMGPAPRYLSRQSKPHARGKAAVGSRSGRPPGTAPSGEVGIQIIEGGLYATARVLVPLKDYAAQWDAMVGDWLPGSGYQPDHRPAMEFYLNNPEADPEGRYDIEICLPVRPL
jgi:AraC family transcriptional regulator